MEFPHLAALPQVAEGVFVAPSAVVIGDVEIGPGASVWYGAVIRGDVNAIRIGSQTNIQDACVVHVSTGGRPCEIGDHCTVGHAAILHSCSLANFAFVGFGAKVLDGAHIDVDGMLAAGAVLTPGKRIGPAELWVGNPAKRLRLLTVDEVGRNRAVAARYEALARAYLLKR